MRMLLDTHALVWLLGRGPDLPASTRALIDAAERRVLSVASVWEWEIKRATGRVGGPELADAAARTGIELLAIEARHAVAAAALPLHHRDPFDRMLVAQAQLEGLVLVSKDEVMRRYGIAVAW